MEPSPLSDWSTSELWGRLFKLARPYLEECDLNTIESISRELTRRYEGSQTSDDLRSQLASLVIAARSMCEAPDLSPKSMARHLRGEASEFDVASARLGAIRKSVEMCLPSLELSKEDGYRPMSVEQAEVLKAITSAPTLLLIVDIAAITGLSPRTVGDICRVLEKRGLITRPQGKRKGVGATEAGRNVSSTLNRL